jgi:DNA-binding NtrC family response regulator
MHSGEAQTILIVEDEEDARHLLEQTLATEGYRVLSATNPAEAFEIMQKARVDVIISDHVMPGMSGLEFIKKAREMFPGIIRIILTGRADAGMAISAINEGEVYRIITKPWNDAELKQTLKNALEKIVLERENRLLLLAVKRQMEILKKLECGEVARLERDSSGAIKLDDVDMEELKALLETT